MSYCCQDQLSGYQDNLKKLVNIVTDSLQLVNKTEKRIHGSRIEDILLRATDKNFRVIVLGEFKRGKSTLLNALLGQAILPAKVPPCSAVITEVMYGETPKAILYHKDVNEGGSGAKPENISFDQLEKYVVIPKGAISTGNDLNIHRTQYQKVEVYYPIEICKNGVILIDSPGLNEDPARTVSGDLKMYLIRRFENVVLFF